MKQNSTILTTFETQLSQRLEKLWRVFSWCSSILISITGAVLFANHTSKIKLAWHECTIISIVVIILKVYGYLWINENLIMEGKIRDQLDKIFSEELDYPAYKELRPDKAKFGYKSVILLLGAVALLATWT
jgi:cytochrome b subunit of formate dehydrogenase